MSEELDKKIIFLNDKLKNNNIQSTRIINTIDRKNREKFKEVEGIIFELNDRLNFYFNKIVEYKKENDDIKDSILRISKNVNKTNREIIDLINDNYSVSNNEGRVITDNKNNIKKTAKVNNLPLLLDKRVMSLENDRKKIIEIIEELDKALTDSRH